MYAEATMHFPLMDGAILSAAVADFKPAHQSENKLKRGKDNLVVEFVPNPDIARKLGEMKSDIQFLVGFALETNDEELNARDKMERKNLDLIVLNSLNDKQAGFGFDTNKVTILGRNGTKNEYELKSKTEVARDIVDEIASLLAK